MTIYTDGTNHYLGTREEASYGNWQNDLQALATDALGNTNYFSHNWPASPSWATITSASAVPRIAFHPADAVDPSLAGVTVTSVGVTTGQFSTATNPSTGWRFASCFVSNTSSLAWHLGTGITNTDTNACNKQNMQTGISQTYTPPVTVLTATSHFFSVMDDRSFILYVTSNRFSSTASSALIWVGATNDNHPTEITQLWLRSGSMVNLTSVGAFQTMGGYGQGFGDDQFYGILPRGSGINSNFFEGFKEASGQPDFGEGSTQTSRIITQYYHRLDQPVLNRYSYGRVNNLAIAEAAAGAIVLNATYIPDISIGTGNNLWRCVGFLPYPTGSRPRYLMMRAYNP